MFDMISLIPLFPLISFIILFATQGNLGKFTCRHPGCGLNRLIRISRYVNRLPMAKTRVQQNPIFTRLPPG